MAIPAEEVNLCFELLQERMEKLMTSCTKAQMASFLSAFVYQAIKADSELKEQAAKLKDQAAEIKEQAGEIRALRAQVNELTSKPTPPQTGSIHYDSKSGNRDDREMGWRQSR